MAGNARPAFIFSEQNSRGGCSPENGKQKTFLDRVRQA